jgi:DinB superfamily
MLTELANIREHWTRYREVTIQHLDMLSDDEMTWRPQPELFTCGQHLIHILQTERYYVYGLFSGDWDPTRLHFPSTFPSKPEMRNEFNATRGRTMEAFDTLTDSTLDDIMVVPTATVELPLRWCSGSSSNTRFTTRRSSPSTSANSGKYRRSLRWSCPIDRTFGFELSGVAPDSAACD